MSEGPGSRPVRTLDMPRVADRFTFLYLERCLVNRDANAITAIDGRGTVHIPSAAVSCLLLGPGTNVTHQAMVLLGESGVSVSWVGERAIRTYASGRSLARNTRYLQQQATLWADRKSRLRVSRTMYDMRFPDEANDHLTLHQLRGKEGVRVRSIYRMESRRTGVAWKGREYDKEDWAAGDPVNRALSAGNACLYGIVNSVIMALGLSPGLGFVHHGNELAFVHDIADLYKAHITIPIAFTVAATLQDLKRLDQDVRRSVRDRATDLHLLERIVTDLQCVLELDVQALDKAYDLTEDLLRLWNDAGGDVAGGVNYGDPW